MGHNFSYSKGCCGCHGLVPLFFITFSGPPHENTFPTGLGIFQFQMQPPSTGARSTQGGALATQMLLPTGSCGIIWARYWQTSIAVTLLLDS